MERGSHETLFDAQGRYWELYTKQHGLEANLFLADGEGDASRTIQSNRGPRFDMPCFRYCFSDTMVCVNGLPSALVPFDVSVDVFPSFEITVRPVM